MILTELSIPLIPKKEKTGKIGFFPPPVVMWKVWDWYILLLKKNSPETHVMC